MRFIKKYWKLILPAFFVILLGGTLFFISYQSLKSGVKTRKLAATVMAMGNNSITVQDADHVIYTFLAKDIDVQTGENLEIEYTGKLNRDKDVQTSKVVSYVTLPVSHDEDGLPMNWLDHGVFENYYILASNKLKTLSLDEKIAQLLLVRYPDTRQVDEVKKYQFAGFVFFEKDFVNKTKEEVKNMISSVQEASKIPLLTAVDEEGGEVTRVSSNSNLVAEKFKSPRELYADGGMEKIRQDTISKSKVLYELGLNLNLAPVVDITTNASAYMYERSLGEDTGVTSNFAKTVIEASKNTGVSYTLKHFPGYSNNTDTHTSSAIDPRTYDEIFQTDLPPFQSGIDVGAEAVLVSHNTVNSIDSNNPASLSPSVHNLLRSNLGFTGIIISDDLDMGATSSIDDVAAKAILAGNDLIITTNYDESFRSIRNAVDNNTIDENLIDKLAFRVLAWKYYKGLMFEQHK